MTRIQPSVLRVTLSPARREVHFVGPPLRSHKQTTRAVADGGSSNDLGLSISEIDVANCHIDTATSHDRTRRIAGAACGPHTYTYRLLWSMPPSCQGVTVRRTREADGGILAKSAEQC
jgi:hypothetical protein